MLSDGVGDRRATERSCEDTDKSDTDLDSRQKVIRLFNQVQGTPCPSIAVLRQVLKTHPTGRKQSDFRHGKDTVDHRERDDDGDFQAECLHMGNEIV